MSQKFYHRGLRPAGVAAIAAVTLFTTGLAVMLVPSDAPAPAAGMLSAPGARVAAVGESAPAVPAAEAPVARLSLRGLADAAPQLAALAHVREDALDLRTALYRPSAEGTRLPGGMSLFAGQPAAMPPARPGDLHPLAGLRPVERPLSGARAMPVDDAAQSRAVAMASADDVRPVARPDMAADTPDPRKVAVADLRPAARPEGVAPRRAAAPRGPVARPEGVMPSDRKLAQAPQPEETIAMAETPLAAPGLDRSPRPNARPQALVQRVAMIRRSAEPAPVVKTAAAPAAQPAAAPARVTPVALAPSAMVRRQASGACSSALTRGIPRRPRGAPGGQALAARMDGLPGADRDRLIAQQMLSGNMPSFLRKLTPVTVAGRRADGQPIEVTICVTPDYLALGSDSDFIRVPMGLPAAAQIADRFGFLLPTTRMVDAIFEQAGLRLSPRPMTPGAQMTSMDYFWRHNQTVDAQTGGRAGVLTAGQKKDLVLTNRLRQNPGRVAIYGWHRPNGRPIQPLSTVHGALYADYSHGVRLVSQTAYVDGRAVPLSDLLANQAYAGLLSDEGPIPAPERLLASLYR